MRVMTFLYPLHSALSLSLLYSSTLLTNLSSFPIFFFFFPSFFLTLSVSRFLRSSPLISPSTSKERKRERESNSHLSTSHFNLLLSFNISLGIHSQIPHSHFTSLLHIISPQILSFESITISPPSPSFPSSILPPHLLLHSKDPL